MKRNFMTIQEAVSLVLQAATLANKGETFVLNMGQQVRILDLAEDLIRLSGLEPGKDIEVIFTGIRAGEKLSEDLWEVGQPYQPTIHPDIFQVKCSDDDLYGAPLVKAVDELEQLALLGDRQAVVLLLDELIPGSSVHSLPPPEITSVDN